LARLRVHGAAAGERLLGWLRARRQPSALACRFVFSASIGLTALLCRQRLSTRFNDGATFRHRPFKPAATLDMLAEQAAHARCWRSSRRAGTGSAGGSPPSAGRATKPTPIGARGTSTKRCCCSRKLDETLRQAEDPAQAAAATVTATMRMQNRDRVAPQRAFDNA